MSHVTQNEDGSYTIVSGHMRLKATLQVHGRAEVLDVKRNKTLYVHEVDGKLVAISEDAQATLDDLTNSIINRAKG